MSNIIAVFGSARVQPDTAVYQACYVIGVALAKAGYTVMTGGYAGVMEATSKGANEAGGIVHGITVDSLEMIGESRVNQWVKKEIRYSSLRERIDHLVDTADAYVIMPGGLGTLQELVEVWQLMRLGDIPDKPLYIYGDFWQPMISSLMDSAYISTKDTAFITQIHGPDELITDLSTWFD